MKSSGSSKTAWVPSLQAALKPRHAAVAVQLQAVLAERWARGVAAQALEVLSVAAIDDDLCVDVHPADLGERFVRRGDEAHGADGADELGRLLSRRRAQELHVPCGGGVAGGEPRLLVDERVGRFVGAVEGATVTLEDPKERGGRPRRDPCHLLAARRGKRVEDERASRVANVHAVERERVEVDIETEGTVAALDEGAGAHEGVLDAAQAELTLRAPAQRACERADERREDVRAQPPIVGQRVAQGPRQRAHPLANRHLGQDLVHEVRGDVGHAAGQARGAEAAAFAREPDEQLVAAAGAREPDDAVLEPTAAQVLVEIAHDEARQTALLLGPLEQAWPVLAHERVEERVLGTAARVAVCSCGQWTGGLAGRRAHGRSSVRVSRGCEPSGGARDGAAIRSIVGRGRRT